MSKWQNKQWAVTDFGLECIGKVEYRIAKEDLAKLRDGRDGVAVWPLQLVEKSWVDFDEFWEAFLKALELHKPTGRESINLQATRAAAELLRHPEPEAI